MQGEKEKIIKAFRKFCSRARVEIKAGGWYAYDPANPEVKQELEQLFSLKQESAEQRDP